MAKEQKISAFQPHTYLTPAQTIAYEEVLCLLHMHNGAERALQLLDSILSDLKNATPAQQAEFYYLRGCVHYKISERSAVIGSAEEATRLELTRQDWRQACYRGTSQRRFFIEKTLEPLLVERFNLYESCQNLQTHIRSIDMLLDVADLCLSVGQPGRATEYLKRITDKSTLTLLQKIRFLRVRGWVFIRQEQIHEAIEELDKASKERCLYEQPGDHSQHVVAHMSGGQKIMSRECRLIELGKIKCRIDGGNFRDLMRFNKYDSPLVALKRSLLAHVKHTGMPRYYLAVYYAIQALGHYQTAKNILQELTPHNITHVAPMYCKAWGSLQVALIKGGVRDNSCRQLLSVAIHQLIEQAVTFDLDDIVAMLNKHFSAFRAMNRGPISDGYELLMQLSDLYLEFPEVWLVLAEEAQRIGRPAKEVRHHFRQVLVTLLMNPPANAEQLDKMRLTALIGLQYFTDARLSAESIKVAWPSESSLPNYLGPFLGHRFKLAKTELLTEATFCQIVQNLLLANLPAELIFISLGYLLELDVEAKSIPVRDSQSEEKLTVTPALSSTPISRSQPKISVCSGLVGKNLSNFLFNQIQSFSKKFVVQQNALKLKLNNRLEALGQPDASAGVAYREHQAIQNFLIACEGIYTPIDMFWAILRAQKSVASDLSRSDGQDVTFYTILANALSKIIDLVLAQQKSDLLKSLEGLGKIFPKQANLFADLAGRCEAASTNSFIAMRDILREEFARITTPSISSTPADLRHHQLIHNALTIFTKLADATTSPADHKVCQSSASHLGLLAS